MQLTALWKLTFFRRMIEQGLYKGTVRYLSMQTKLEQ